MGRENNSFTGFFFSPGIKKKKHQKNRKKQQIYTHDVKAPTDIFI